MRWVIPAGAPTGQYDAKVAVYDLDVYANWSRNPLVNVYGDFAGNSKYGNPPSDIEKLTLDKYIQLCRDYPNIFYGYYRQNPRDVVIDYAGWRQNCFTVS